MPLHENAGKCDCTHAYIYTVYLARYVVSYIVDDRYRICCYTSIIPLLYL